MKNKFRRVITIFLSLSLCCVFNVVQAQSSNKPHKVKITKPGKAADGIDGVQNNLKEIGKNDYDLRIKEKYRNDGIYYNVYEVFKDGIVVYDAGITSVSINGNIKQIFSYIPDSVKFENYNHDAQFNNKWLGEYEINKTTLVYFFNEDDNSYNIVWKVGTIKEGIWYNIFVENKSGEILESNRVVRNYQDVTVAGSVNTLYNGNKTITLTKRDYPIGQDEYYLMHDEISSGGIIFVSGSGWQDRVNWINDENVWTETNDRIAASAFWVMQKAYTFFYNSLGYDTNDYGYFKAWKDTAAYDGIAGYDSENSRIIYGKAVFGVHNTAVSLDIIGHEYGHKIIHDKGGGIQNNYRDEMAALEESYADIFGRCLQENVESYNAGRIEVLGEDIAIDPTIKRSFSNPNSLGFHYEGMSETPILGQPDTYEGDYFYRGTLDFGGAHINGGVINYWFYLLTHGGTGINDFNDSYNVTGIGSNKVFQIVYHSLPLLMYETSFSDARNATIIAAENLYGLGSNESQQVLNAWEAVGVDGNCLSSEIVAPDIICSQGTSVYIDNPPSGATIIWNKSSNISRVSAQGSNPCTFVATSSGEGWVEAIIDSGCGNDTLRREYSWVGNPGPITLYDDPTYFACGQMNIVNVDFGDYTYYDMGIFQVNWSYQGATLSNINDGFTKAYITAGSTPGVGFIYVDAYNLCGSSGNRAYYEIDCFMLKLAITPNPANGETIISIEEDGEDAGLKSATTATVFDESAEWDLEIYTPGQTLKEKKTKLKGKRTKIQTQGWQEGVYVVRVKYKDEILTDKLVVKK